MSVPKRLQKIFDPIGLGSLKELKIAYRNSHTTTVKDLNEKSAAAPTDGELWIVAVLLCGHFNGPKRERFILTDGDVVIESNSCSPHDIDRAITFKQGLTDKYITKIALKYIKETVFEDPDGMTTELPM
jgi:hypothetical protein